MLTISRTFFAPCFSKSDFDFGPTPGSLRSGPALQSRSLPKAPSSLYLASASVGTYVLLQEPASPALIPNQSSVSDRVGRRRRDTEKIPPVSLRKPTDSVRYGVSAGSRAYLVASFAARARPASITPYTDRISPYGLERRFTGWSSHAAPTIRARPTYPEPRRTKLSDLDEGDWMTLIRRSLGVPDLIWFGCRRAVSG